MPKAPADGMRFAAFMVALASPLACLAADWVRVPASGADQHFYDQSKINISGDEVTYWRKVAFARPVRVKAGVAKSALYRERMHCRDHTLRALSWQLLADEGAVIESSTAPESEAGSIVPETVGDRFQSVMCGFAEARKLREAEERAVAAERQASGAAHAVAERDAQLAQILADMKRMGDELAVAKAGMETEKRRFTDAIALLKQAKGAVEEAKRKTASFNALEIELERAKGIRTG